MRRPSIEWTDDCQGKKDYDGAIIKISTRYWPRGGGFSSFGPRGFETNADTSIRPSAKSELIMACADGDLTLASGRFEGDTFEEVKAQVEAFAQEQFTAIAALVDRLREGS